MERRRRALERRRRSLKRRRRSLDRRRRALERRRRDVTRQATMGGIRSMRSAVTAFAMATAHLVRTVAAGDADRPWARDRGEGSPRVVADMRIQVGSGCVSARSHRWRHSTSRADRPPLPRCECMAVPRLRAGASRFVRMRPGAYLRGNSMSVRPKRSGTCPDAHRAEGVVPRRARRSGLLLLGAASAAVDDSQVERRSIERFGPGGAAHHDVLQPHAPAALDVDARLNAEGHAGLEGLGIS